MKIIDVSALPLVRTAIRGPFFAAEAVGALIHDGDMVASGGFVGIGRAEEIAITRDLLYADSEMAKGFDARFYTRASWYTTNGFLWLKLGAAFRQQGVVPHRNGNEGEARANVSARPNAMG